jgi:Na+-transporting NADH:ubiquinone oxidoreductase subunit NqrC
MKKLVTLLVIGAMAFMCSCGPSAKEKAEKQLQDSIHQQDSIKAELVKQHIADSTAAVEKLKAEHQDSITNGWIDKDGKATKKLIDEQKKIEKAKKAEELKAKQAELKAQQKAKQAEHKAKKGKK